MCNNHLFNLRKSFMITFGFFLFSFSVLSQTAGWINAYGYGGTGDDKAYALTVDKNGNFYIVGEYMSQSMTLGTSVLTNANKTSTNLFVTKVDASGNVIWAKGFGEFGKDDAKCVTTDATGNVYIGGSFNSDSISFDGGTTYLKNSCQGCGWEDLFFAKFSSTGSLIWAKKAGGADWEYAKGIAVDNNNNVYVTGNFTSDTIYFDSLMISDTNNTSEIFLAKYNSAGKLIWVKNYGKSLFNESNGVVCDNSGNIYITGTFEELSLNLGTQNLLNNGNNDVFLIKFGSAGNVLWAKNAGSSHAEYGKAITMDAAGNVYITGEFASDDITFGAYQILNKAQAANTIDIYVAKFSPDGTAQYAKSFGGVGDEYVSAIAIDGNNNAYVIGSFSGSKLEADTRYLWNSNSNVGEIYMIKLSDAGAISFAVRATGNLDDDGRSVVIWQGTPYGTGYFKSMDMKFSWLPIARKGLYDFFFGKIGLVASVDNILDLNEHFKVYPNPSTDGLFRLESDQMITGNLNIKVYDVMGKEVFNRIFTPDGSSDLSFTLGDSRSGIYQLYISGDDGQKISTKLIIQ